MKKLYFINYHEAIGSIKMRCYHVNDVLFNKGYQIEIIENNHERLYKIKDSIIFFFKYIYLLIDKKVNFDILKNNKNIIVFDTIDITSNFDYRLNFDNDFYKKFNYIITPSYYIKKQNLSNKKIIYIPHHYDPILQVKINSKKINKLLYNGLSNYTIDSSGKSIIDKVSIKFILSFDDFINNINEYSKYKYHLSLYPNNELEYLLKPITKVATASVLDSIIICTKTDETLFWLGEDYPFYINGSLESIKEIVYKIENNLLDINDVMCAFEKMQFIKNKLSINNIVDEYYINFLETCCDI